PAPAHAPSTSGSAQTAPARANATRVKNHPFPATSRRAQEYRNPCVHHPATRAPLQPCPPSRHRNLPLSGCNANPLRDVFRPQLPILNASYLNSRQVYGESASMSEAGTLGKHATTMFRNHRVNDEQSQARSFHSRHEAPRHTIKTLEDTLQLRTLNSNAFVRHSHRNAFAIQCRH